MKGFTCERRFDRRGERWLKDADLQRLLSALNAGGEEARIAGGAVRNALLGEPVADVDIATTTLPEETVRRAEAAGFKTIPTGIEHGTVTVIASGRRLRGDDAARRRRDRRAPREGDLRPRLEGATRSGATSPSTRSTPRPTARLSISSAGLPISKAGRCASSATPKRASARTICASCASSASSPGTARAGRTPRG